MTDAVGLVPWSRWDVEATYRPIGGSGGSYSLAAYVRHGAFLEDIWAFDAGAFRLAGAEAAAMDPQHRILLELAGLSLQELGDGMRVDRDTTGETSWALTDDALKWVYKWGLAMR